MPIGHAPWPGLCASLPCRSPNPGTYDQTPDPSAVPCHRPVPEGDQTIEGWSGSIDLEVKDASVDEFIDALVANNLNGIGVSDYTFMSTESYADGTLKSYIYFDVQWKMSKRQAGLTEKMTKRLEFQASGRLPL